MSEQSLYVCCIFSSSCPHRAARALEDDMDGTWEDSVTDDFDQLECLLSSTASLDDPNSTDGDFTNSSINRVIVQSLSTFPHQVQQSASFTMDESTRMEELDDDSLMPVPFDITPVDVSMANVVTSIMQEAIEEEHPHLLSGRQYDKFSSSRSTNSSANCDNSEPVEDLQLALREIGEAEDMLNTEDLAQMNILEDDIEADQQSSSQIIAEDSTESIRPLRKRGRPPKKHRADKDTSSSEPKPKRNAAPKDEAQVQPKIRGRPRKHEKIEPSSSNIEVAPPPAPLKVEAVEQAGWIAKDEAQTQPKIRGRPRKHDKNEPSSSIPQVEPTPTTVNAEPAEQAEWIATDAAQVQPKIRGRPRKHKIIKPSSSSHQVLPQPTSLNVEAAEQAEWITIDETQAQPKIRGRPPKHKKIKPSSSFPQVTPSSMPVNAEPTEQAWWIATDAAQVQPKIRGRPRKHEKSEPSLSIPQVVPQPTPLKVEIAEQAEWIATDKAEVQPKVRGRPRKHEKSEPSLSIPQVAPQPTPLKVEVAEQAEWIATDKAEVQPKVRGRPRKLEKSEPSLSIPQVAPAQMPVDAEAAEQAGCIAMDEAQAQPKIRGRPRKHDKNEPTSSIPQVVPTPTTVNAEPAEQAEWITLDETQAQPKIRGRPRNHEQMKPSSSIPQVAPPPTPLNVEAAEQAPMKKRGRPKKDASKMAVQPATMTTSSPNADDGRSLASPTPSSTSSSASSSTGRKTVPIAASLAEQSLPTETPPAAAITASTDGTIPCELRLSRLTEEELMLWTGSKTPVVWRPNTDDLKITISLGSAGDSIAKVTSASSATVTDNVEAEPEKRKRGRPKNDSETAQPTTLPSSKHTSLPPPPATRPPRPTASAKETKVKPGGDLRCFSCNALLVDKVDDWLNELGSKSVYCSVACIDVQVAKANELLHDADEHVSVIDQGCGKLVGAPAAPRLRELGQFLRGNANFCPVLPAKAQERPGVQKIEADSSTDRGKTAKLLSPQVDTIRMNVRRAVKDSLHARAKDAEDLLLTSSEVKEVAVRIEEVLFRQCRQSTAGRYKLWCKHFLTHLKDPNNQGLFRRVLSGELSPAKLASLEPTELGSKALSDLPAVLLAVDSGAIFSSLQVDNDAKVVEEVIISKPVAQKIVAGRQSRDALDDLLDTTRDTTSEHKSHLFDQNCCICTGKIEADTEKSKRKKKKSSRTSSSKEKTGASNQEDNSTSLSADHKAKRKDDATMAVSVEQQPISSLAHPQAYEDDHVDTAIDDYNVYGYSPPTEAAKWSPKAEEDPWTLDLRIWSGEMVMAGYFRFESTLTAVSGVGAFALRDVLPTEIQIVGRIPPIVVWEYIKTVKRTMGKDLIVLQANEPDDAESKAQYEGLFNNMRAKGRYVVVGRLNHRIVKDFYLLPLSSHDLPPEELLPFDGIGLAPPGARRNVILCVVVRNREDAPIPQPVPPPDVNAQQDEVAHFDDNELSEASSAPASSISPTMMPVGLSKTAKDAENERVKNVIYGMMEQPASSLPEYTVVRTWTVPGKKGVANGLDDAYDPGDDYFIPPHMMESEKRPPATPAETASGPAQNVGDLLIAIHTGDDPAKVAELVQTFLAERDLKPGEQQIVLKALASKVSQEKARRSGDAAASPANRSSVPVPKLIPIDEPNDIQLDEPAMSFMSQSGPPSFMAGEWRVPPRTAQRPAAQPPVDSLAKQPTKGDDDMDIEDGEICSDRETPNDAPPRTEPPSTELGHLLLPPPPPPPDFRQVEKLPPPPPPRQMPLVAEEADEDHPVVTQSVRQPKRPSRPWNNTIEYFSQPSYGDNRATNNSGQWNDGFKHDSHPGSSDPSAASHHYESNDDYVDEMQDQPGWNGAGQGPMRPPWGRGHGGPSPRFPPPPPFRGRGAPVFGRGMQRPRFPGPMHAPFNRAPFPFRPRGPPRFARPPFRGGTPRFRPPPPNFYENY